MSFGLVDYACIELAIEKMEAEAIQKSIEDERYRQ